LPFIGYEYAGLVLRLDSGVALYAPGGELIDSVSYSGSAFPTVFGRAASLDAAKVDHEKNDLASNWCPAADGYLFFEPSFGSPAGHDFGTPGEENPECFPPAACGNGVVEYLEECDDGGGAGGEGSFLGRAVAVALPWNGGATGLRGSSPFVPVVQPADLGKLDDFAHAGGMHWPRNGAVLVQRQMRS